MTREQIEKKAKEMANKYPANGYNSKYHREIYSAAMEMAEWLLYHQWVSNVTHWMPITPLAEEGGEK